MIKYFINNCDKNNYFRTNVCSVKYFYICLYENNQILLS